MKTIPHQWLAKVHLVTGWLVILVSLWMGSDAVTVARYTSGQVVGSEFMMLIMLTNMMAKLIIWLMCATLWKATEKPQDDLPSSP